MKLHFDSNQEYQLDAIKSITDIFEGQPLNGGDFEFSIYQAGALHTDNGFGNRLSLSGDQIWENVKAIQAVNEIKSDKDGLEGMNSSAFFIICRMTTVDSSRPLAQAVRM